MLLGFPQVLHDIPKKYIKLQPRFKSEKERIVEEHINIFQDLMTGKFMEEEEDVFMRLLVQTLEGEV